MRLRSILGRAALALAVIGALMVVFAVVTPQGRTAAKTAGLVFQVLPAIPAKPLEWYTADPLREEVSFPQAQGEGVARHLQAQEQGWTGSGPAVPGRQPRRPR